MRMHLGNTLTGLLLCTVAGCASGDEEGAVDLDSQALARAGSAAPAAGSGIAAAAATQARVPDGFSDMRLALIDGQTARLSLRVGADERRLRKVSDKEPVLRLAVDPNSKAIELNDVGRAPDLRAGDGLFSAAIPIDLDGLARLNEEVAGSKQRTAVRFVPGTHESLGSFELPRQAIDVAKLKSGAEIQLLPIGEFGPFKTLGAVVTSAINPQKSLVITSLPVIQDAGNTMNPCDLASANSPLKAWTFGHLIEQMAQGSGVSASDFVEKWLGNWRTTTVVKAAGGSPTLDATSDAARANMDALVINPWRARSGGGALDLRIAPFRLQGIFYRPDLGGVSYGGVNNSGGELRFVFGLMEARDANNDGDAKDASDTCQITEMAVIFEYGVPIDDCKGIKDFANQFVNLSTLLQGTPAYTAALTALTESVVKHGAAPAKPNQNALNQLRTNEIDLSGVWQLREFVLPKGNGPLQQTTTKNNPRQHMVSSTSVAGTTPAPIDLSATDVWLSELTTPAPLPELSGGKPFLSGGLSYFPMVWDSTLLTPAQFESRFNFSLNTCSSCHTNETQTSFYHVRPAGPGASPTLSSFLNVSPFPVTDVHGLTHTFQEKDNRKQALANLANATCGKPGFPPFEILRKPLVSVH